MRILVVEDEPKTGDYLKKGLSESGFVVDLARTGPDGRHHEVLVSIQIKNSPVSPGCSLPRMLL